MEQSFTVEELAAEEWRELPGFDGFYEASNLGRVRSWRAGGSRAGLRRETPRLLTPVELKDNKYLVVTLRDVDKRKVMMTVHKVVLLSWVGEPPPGHEARHFPDFDKKNNRTTNISCSSHTVNMADVRGTKRGPYTTATDEIKARVEALRLEGISFYRISRIVGMSSAGVAALCKRLDRERRAA